MLSARVPDELLRRLRVVAAKNGMSVQEIVVGLVAAYVAKKEAEQGG
jgi:plasmid stability protein